jgi:hypothetical protein
VAVAWTPPGRARVVPPAETVLAPAPYPAL